MQSCQPTVVGVACDAERRGSREARRTELESRRRHSSRREPSVAVEAGGRSGVIAGRGDDGDSGKRYGTAGP